MADMFYDAESFNQPIDWITQMLQIWLLCLLMQNHLINQLVIGTHQMLQM